MTLVFSFSLTWDSRHLIFRRIGAVYSGQQSEGIGWRNVVKIKRIPGNAFFPSSRATRRGIPVARLARDLERGVVPRLANRGEDDVAGDLPQPGGERPLASPLEVAKRRERAHDRFLRQLIDSEDIAQSRFDTRKESGFKVAPVSLDQKVESRSVSGLGALDQGLCGFGVHDAGVHVEDE